MSLLIEMGSNRANRKNTFYRFREKKERKREREREKINGLCHKEQLTKCVKYLTEFDHIRVI